MTPSLQLLWISGTIVSQCLSESATVISSTVFDFEIVFAAITATFLAVVDQSNSCMLIGQFCLIAVVLAVVTLCFAIHGGCLICKVK